MAALSIADVSANVTVGVDTHKHSHLARAKDGLGRYLGQLRISKPTHTATPIFWTGPKDSDQSSPLALRAPAVTAPA
jgi:hypothetical protein